MKDFQSGNSKVDVILLLTIILLSLFLFLLPVKFKEERMPHLRNWTKS